MNTRNAQRRQCHTPTRSFVDPAQVDAERCAYTCHFSLGRKPMTRSNLFNSLALLLALAPPRSYRPVPRTTPCCSSTPSWRMRAGGRPARAVYREGIEAIPANRPTTERLPDDRRRTDAGRQRHQRGSRLPAGPIRPCIPTRRTAPYPASENMDGWCWTGPTRPLQ